MIGTARSDTEPAPPTRLQLHGPAATQVWRRLVPVTVSVVLVAWLVWRVSWPELVGATVQLKWHWLVPLTALVVVALYLWDTLCVTWLFAGPEKAVSYRIVLRCRGLAYLAGAINYGLGQGMLAWMMAGSQGTALVSALGRFVLLACHDVAVLLGVGLVASTGSADLRMKKTQVFCAVGLAVLAGLVSLGQLVPTTWRLRAKTKQWWAWLGSWTWQRSASLCLLRLVNFGISITYAAAALTLCGVRLEPAALFSAVPMIQLTEGLPVTVSGLGTRESTLLYLLNPDRPEVVLAFGLVWSTGLIAGRLAIGLAHLWISPHSPLRAGQNTEHLPR